MTTRDDDRKEAFLDRWSRLKQDAKDAPAQKAPEPVADPKAPPPELPPVDTLTIESDFRGFFHPKVGDDVRRAALKKLFSDPRFNVMDGLDVYIDDYSKSEPIPPEMLAGLRQAQKILEWAREDTEERKRKELEQAATQQRIEPPASPGGQPAAAANADVTTPEPAPASNSNAAKS
jgi:hypothetical protein